MPMYRKTLLLLIVFVLIGAGASYYSFENTPPVLDEEKGEAREIAVYVTGAVERPGVIKLREGARGEDAIAACGGMLPTADAASVNLAQVLKDGVQLNVLETVDSPAVQARAGEGKINLNTADEQVLDTLPGVGPVLAKNILEYRKTHGAFRTVDELRKVKGIGDAKFEKLKDKVTL